MRKFKATYQVENKRYALVPILTGKFGDAIAQSDDLDAIEHMASRYAYDYYYGVAILDHHSGIAILGDSTVPIDEVWT